MTSSSEDDRQASQPETIAQNCARGSQRSLKRRLITSICPANVHSSCKAHRGSISKEWPESAHI